jgi:RHS repeat-associated protein
VPIEGVEVRSDFWITTTDANGRFSFTNLPYGSNLFEFDPSTATDGKTYTPVNLSFEVRPGRKTVWERPVYLAEYDPADGVSVVSNSPEDQVIENPNLPGVRVIIPANTEIDFPDGSDSGVVTIVDIPVALSPNCLGAGVRPSRLISLQPENTRLSQPAQLIFPNDLNLSEGTTFDLMSLNIETGIFGKIGVASVVNGEVATDTGSGLRTFDWHTNAPVTPEINEVNTETNDTENAEEGVVCSTMILRTGELMEDHSIPAYYSLDGSRAVSLHYSSLIAAPELLVNAELTRIFRAAVPDVLSIATSTPAGSAQSFFTSSDLTAGSSVSAARSMDASGLSTGEYELTTRVTGQFTRANGNSILNSRTRNTTVDIFNGRDLYPALGTGWSVSNVSRLLFDGDGDVVILSGRGRTTRFEEGGVASEVGGEEVSINNLGFELGLVGTGRSGFFGNQEDPRSIVSNLGFIQPTEGKQMLLLQNTDENGLGLNRDLAISIPLQRKPFGANSLVFDLDLLADELIADGSGVLLVTLDYRDPSASLYSTTNSKRSFGDVYGGIFGSSQFSTVLAGGDSGYASRSGFRTMGVNIGEVPFGAPMCLRIQLDNAPTPDGYGGINPGIARAAALIDNLRYNYTPGSRGISFDRSYASEAGDYSTLGFDSSSGIYARLFQDGTLQKFNSAGLEVSITDRFGNETRYEYTDGVGDGEDDELARIIDPVGLVTEFTYQNGKLHQITDPVNRVTELTYDAKGHLLQILGPDGTTRSFTYDAKGKLLSQTDGESNQRFYTYQPGSSRLASVTRADGQVYEYAPQQTRGLPAAGTGSEVATASLYQSGTLGKNTVSTDARGIQTSKALNENGQPSSVTDNLGNEIEMQYDSNRNLTSMVAANDQEFDFTYDAFGNMTYTVRDFDNATTRIEYDTSRFDLPVQVTDPLGRTYDFEYDAQGNLIRTTDPLNQISEFTYNAVGQVLTATDKLGQVSTYAYDSLGRLVSITDKLSRTVTFGYDAAGNQATVIDPQGRVTTTEYDNAGDPVRVIAPDRGVTQFFYDGNKNLLRLVDSLGREKSWTYDERERVISYTDALGRTTFMQYDEVGNLIAYTREDGTVIEYVYDDVNRVSEVKYPELPGVAADAVTYTYDELYRVTNQSDNDSAIDYAFDPISRLTSTTQTWNSQADTLSFAYDLIDRRIGMADATGTSTYVYDDLDRMTGLTDSAARAFGFAYDPLDRLTRKIMANGTATDFTYDPASQLLDIITEKVNTSEVIESIAYTYNTTGTRSSETRLDGNARTFFYDANDRVTQVINSQLPSDNELFAYDLIGNWTTDSRQHNTENELTQDSGYTYSYDSLGNMTVRQSLSDSTDLTTYAWDARNLLIAVDGPVSDTSYAYDARNRRVAKTVDGATTQYVHDGLNVLLEYDGAGNLLARNTHAGLDQLCVRDEVAASTPYYVCQDALSSVLSVSDDNGNVLQRYRYSAFGEQKVLDANFNSVTDASPIPFAYTGREWEPEVGMYFYRARFYDPVLGRFISRDPIGLSSGDVNFYAYVGNDPINYVDPLGLLQADSNVSSNYPKAAKFIESQFARNQKEYNSFKKYGQADKKAVDKALTKGQGPTVSTYKDMGTTNGTFSPGIGSQTLNISDYVLGKFEVGDPGARLLLESTLKHELTHYFDDQNEMDYPGEEGKAFEQDVYGQDVDRNNAANLEKKYPCK